jgi:hypothetical protein
MLAAALCTSLRCFLSVRLSALHSSRPTEPPEKKNIINNAEKNIKSHFSTQPPRNGFAAINHTLRQHTRKYFNPLQPDPPKRTSISKPGEPVMVALISRPLSSSHLFNKNDFFFFKKKQVNIYI